MTDMSSKPPELIAENDGSSVYRCFAGNEPAYAEKKIIKSKYKYWKKEFEILKKVGSGHENIVRYYPTAAESASTIVLKMELCHADMEKYVKNQEISDWNSNDKICKVLAKDFFQISVHDACFQAIKGLNYLHVTHSIIHREIKPSNFLLLRTAESKTLVKVADFGLSKQVEEDTSYHSNTSTLSPFAAPECHDKKWKKASDIFSLGVFLYYAFTDGCHPFGKNPFQQESNIRNKVNPNFEEIRKKSTNFSKEQVVTLIDLIKRMIKHNPEDRFNIDQVLHHPTFWSSEKKVRFYVRIKSKAQSLNADTLNHYDCRLLDDDKEGVEKFAISKESIPNCVKYHHRHYSQKYKGVKDLLRVIRNVEAHAWDKDNSKNYRKTLGIQKDRINWDKFLSALTGDFPQLLVHLYELFSKLDIASEFYCGDLSNQFSSSVSLSKTSGSRQISSSKHLDWKTFFQDKYNGASSIFDYQLTAMYDGRVVLEEVFNLKEKQVKVFYPLDISESPDMSVHEFRFPEVEESVILSNCTDGVILSTDASGNTLFATRQCVVQVFFSSCGNDQVKKLERKETTSLFSHQLLQQQLQKAEKPIRNDVRLDFGKDPYYHNTSPVVLLIKPIVAISVKEQFSFSNEHDILLSFE